MTLTEAFEIYCDYECRNCNKSSCEDCLTSEAMRIVYEAAKGSKN